MHQVCCLADSGYFFACIIIMFWAQYMRNSAGCFGIEHRFSNKYTNETSPCVSTKCLCGAFFSLVALHSILFTTLYTLPNNYCIVSISIISHILWLNELKPSNRLASLSFDLVRFSRKSTIQNIQYGIVYARAENLFTPRWLFTVVT